MIKSILIFATILIALGACQKVIDVDLNDSNSNIVLEANYTAEDSTVRVRITSTSSFFNSNNSPEINDAIVSIIDQAGNSTLVNFIGNGNYELTAYAPIYNTTYTMNVIQNGETYSAICNMHSVVNLENITYEFFPGFFGGESGYIFKFL